MMPPWATALTTAADVQLAGVPWPTTWFGWLVLTARAATGTGWWPFGLPTFTRVPLEYAARLPATGALGDAVVCTAATAASAIAAPASPPMTMPTLPTPRLVRMTHHARPGAQCRAPRSRKRGERRSAGGKGRGRSASRAQLRLERGELAVHVTRRGDLVQLLLDIVAAAADVLEHAGLQQLVQRARPGLHGGDLVLGARERGA